MATASSRPYEKPVKVVRYGKRKATPVANAFFDYESEHTNPPSAHLSEHVFEIEKPFEPVSMLPSKAEARQSTAGASTKTAQKRPAPSSDPYSVPPSDEDNEPTISRKRRSPAHHLSIPPLVDDTDPTLNKLAPWEVSKEKPRERTQKQGKGAVGFVPSTRAKPETLELNGRLVHCGDVDYKQENTSRTMPKDSAPATSAAARLAAKRQTSAKQSAPKSAEAGVDASVKRQASDFQRDMTTSRKRSRKCAEEKTVEHEVVMGDRSSLSQGAPDRHERLRCEFDAFDARQSGSGGKGRTLRKGIATPPKKNLKRTGTEAITDEGPRPAAHSMPPRLADMLAADSDTTDQDTTCTTPSRPSTPREPTAPAASTNVSRTLPPVTKSPHSVASLTPNQTRVWDKLLRSDVCAPSPSSIPIKELNLSERRQENGGNARLPPALAKPVSYPGRVRRADALKAEMKTVPAFQEYDSEQNSADEEMEDAQALSLSQDTTASKNSSSQLAQNGQSQSVGLGPKITYSAMRSYLPEDTLEGGVMLGFSGLASQMKKTSASQAKGVSQVSEFDLEDNDDDHEHARLKSVHELRAAGREFSFMQETESLLEEIANHTSSARSRRRSALVELALKLREKSFVEQFMRRGFEERLVQECQAAKDDIADFVLTTAFAFLLCAEIPVHGLVMLEGAGLLTWLASLLSNGVSLEKLARERRNNMSRSAQLALTGDFAANVSASGSLWEHYRPATLSPRLMALKALDLIINKLRRAGNTSQLLPLSTLHSLAPEREFALNNIAETNLAVSVLEALSTSSANLVWPEDVVSRVAVFLPLLPKIDDMPQHTIFLMLRLTLNLSNDNPLSCEAFAREDVILYLLSSIRDGFVKLDKAGVGPETALPYDLLVLALGVMINLAEQNAVSREIATQREVGESLSSLMDIFQRARERAGEAESIEQSSTNVPFGYLSIMLANLCQSSSTRKFIASKLPLDVLESAVEEFVMYHQQVDSLGDNAEGAEIWSAFTAKLKAVLERLKAV